MDSWYVKVTEENRELLKDFIGRNNGWMFTIGSCYGINNNGKKWGSSDDYDFDREISTEEFYQKIGLIKEIQYEIC